MNIKTLIALAFISLSLFSCKKTYTCTCSNEIDISLLTNTLGAEEEEVEDDDLDFDIGFGDVIGGGGLLGGDVIQTQSEYTIYDTKSNARSRCETESTESLYGIIVLQTKTCELDD